MRSSFTLLLMIIWSFGQAQEVFTRYPDESDSINVKAYINLSTDTITTENYQRFFHLAESLFELGRNDEAEPLYETILTSSITPLTGTYWNNSDVPGDTNSNRYGYGSFAWNYKHPACIGLAKIYLERGQYDTALHYVTRADSTYPLTYNCGTGYHMYRNRMNDLYGRCYCGLNDLERGLELLLPNCMNWNRGNDHLIQLIQKNYSRDSLIAVFDLAVEEMRFEQDSIESTTYEIHGWGTENADTIYRTYRTGIATITIFGQDIILESPTLNDGETLTRAGAEKLFRSSPFFQKLTGNVIPIPIPNLWSTPEFNLSD